MRVIGLILGISLLQGCANLNLTEREDTGQQAVAMPDSFSAQVALDVLNDGGNAVDAAVAAQFALAVTYPEAGNIGGGGFMTIFADNEANIIDYREMAPGRAHRDMYLTEDGEVHPTKSLYGPLAAGVPGTVAGMWEAHKAYGSLPWERLVQPAVTLAEEGFIMPEHLYQRIQRFQNKLLSKGIETNFSHYFGQAYTGEKFVQPELAETLKRIRDNGRDGFYRGEVARSIVSFFAQNDGVITFKDLSLYKAKWRAPIVTYWGDYILVTPPPPSSGGIAVAQAIGMIDDILKGKPKPAFNSPEYVHLLAEVSKRIFADRAEYLGDPDVIDVPIEALLDDDYIAQRASEVNLTAISPTDNVKPGLYESPDTTHFSIMDRWGNAVANTTTINLSFGSGVVVDGAGFLLNDEMDDFSAKPGVPNFFGAIGGEANAIAPYKRMLSSMTPTILFKDANAVLVTGSPGGTTIISSVLESIIQTQLYGMTAQEAADAPRVHHQLWPENTISVHDGVPQQTRDALEAMGYIIKQSNFGDLQIITNQNGVLQAGSESRGRGKAIVEKVN